MVYVSRGGVCYENAASLLPNHSCRGALPNHCAGDAQSHRKAAENLLMVMEVNKSLPKVVDQVVENQLQQNPQLAPQQEILQRFLTK